MKEPLNLPRGSVRAIITLFLTVTPFVLLVVPIQERGTALTGSFALAAIAVRDYFEHRRQQNAEDGPVQAEPYIGDDR